LLSSRYAGMARFADDGNMLLLVSALLLLLHLL
jgi:hypothetical protein